MKHIAWYIAFYLFVALIGMFVLFHFLQTAKTHGDNEYSYQKNKLNSTVSELQEQNRKLTTDNKQQQEHNRKLSAENEKLTAELTALQNTTPDKQLSEAQKIVAEQKQKIEELNQELFELKNKPAQKAEPRAETKIDRDKEILELLRDIKENTGSR